MKTQAYAILSLILSLLFGQNARAVEATWEYAVQVSAAVQSSPPRITLSWPQDTIAVPSSYTVYRKTASATSWGIGTTLPGSATSYADANVSAGTAYEYQIVKTATGYNGYGYIYAGIEAPLVDSRGKVVLLVDNTYTASLAGELARLQQDLVGDGWTVLRHDVSASDSVASVKALIQADYSADPANVKAVFLFGHVPILRSGNLNVDGHQARPMPADPVYADMDNWTGSPSYIPTAVELQVGRVDLSNMPGYRSWQADPSFPSELELLRNYLNKDHNFRHALLTAPRRGMVGDRFGCFSGEAFAASGYRNFAPMFGASQIKNLNLITGDAQGVWIPDLAINAYLWAHGSGAGSYSSIGSLGNHGQYYDAWSLDMRDFDVKSVFFQVFGSWLCEWDTQDNFMRAFLCAPTYGLGCVFSGRPHWFMHHMALGETIGYSTRLTMNNGASGLYKTQVNSSAGGVHLGLMGDPTLRLHPVIPPSSLTGSIGGGGAQLNWTASSDSIVGYHVYRAAGPSGPFTRLTAACKTGTAYADTSVVSGTYTYLVRAVKLESTPSGSYYNASQGIYLTLSGSGTPPPADTTAPTVSLTAPLGNATVTGASVAVTANAADNVGVAGVQFKLDGANLGTEAMVAPYSVNWDTTAATNGSHNLTAVARDAAGNKTTSAAVTVLVSNTAPASTTTIWVEDALPAGAVSGADGGDTWTWASSNPTPKSGAVAVQSSLATGLHQLYFDWATTTLPVSAGECLCAYVYLDPVNPPTQVMLQWTDGSWEHRAYWGANNLGYGTDGTASCHRVGPLPAAGQWVQLLVPASSVGLEGSNLRGMAFSLYGGKATWDCAGKTAPAPAPALPVVTVAATVATATEVGQIPGVFTISRTGATTAALTVNYTLTGTAVAGTDYTSSGATAILPAGATSTAINITPLVDTLIKTNATVIMTLSTQAAYTLGAPNSATVTLNDNVIPPDTTAPVVALSSPANGTTVAGGSVAVTANASDNVGVAGVQFKLDGVNLGAELTVAPYTTSWNTTLATNGNHTLTAVARDAAGNQATAAAVSVVVSHAVLNEFVWIEDALPEGAVSGAEGGDAWTWVNSNPTPSSGTLAVQSGVNTAVHQLFFDWATATLPVDAGDCLFAYVYLDPSNPPSQVMLQWNNGSWEHRACWGVNKIGYGIDGTASCWPMGPLPAVGKWVRLEVPASAVGLGGSTLKGLAFTLYGGRATWDRAGKSAAATAPVLPPPTVIATNPPPALSAVDYVDLTLPAPGVGTLHVLSPTLLELELINSKQPDPSPIDSWNFVDANNQFVTPSLQEFAVTLDGKPVTVQSVGFKRRPFYAPLVKRDLRVQNCLYLQLAGSVTDNQAVEVKNPSGKLWTTNLVFATTSHPLRYSPAVHVNQEGYLPAFSKKAMVGYYLGNLGEMDIPATTGFRLVDAANLSVYQGTLAARPDYGYAYTPTPYQKVYEADFSSFTKPGEYRLVVPGMGASLPFLIDEGIAMSFSRAYALGLYHQRCGVNNALPFTRFTHDACHSNRVEVPSPQSAFAFTWTTIAQKSADYTNNVRHTAPQLKDEASQLYPFVNQGKIDVAGGHHDAGDYSKYTINSASLVHYLMFQVDAFPGVAALDNLGLPESGDGISDIMQEAKAEADFLAKMQDADGGFYFLVYPRDREYESNVLPDHGDAQVVWPKTTATTAASVAALAQCASSPRFKQQYPKEAAWYLQKAQLGWSFLTNAIAKYGKDGSYQKITHYGDNFMHDDELAWAACEMFLATGNAAYQAQLKAWFDPSDPGTWRWGWWHMSECYGHAIRSYAFAVKTGRLTAGQLDPAFLAKCQTEIATAGSDASRWSQQNAYGSSFPEATKRVLGAGWFFSTDQAFDLAVAYQLDARPEYLTAMLANMNYEGGCNPLNITYVTGLGWKRQREIVHQYAQNDGRILPPSGIPLGNIQASFSYLGLYKGELGALCFPSDSAAVAPYPFYDRWADTFNVSTEFVVLDQARSLGTLAVLATQTSLTNQSWKTATAQIVASTNQVPVNTPVTLSLQVAGMSLQGARVVWEAREQEPAYGDTFTFSPKCNGAQWVEAEAQWPDGRRVSATSSVMADSPTVVWVEDALPAGAMPGADGGDAWNWINANPTPFSGTLAQQSSLAPGIHQHYFYGATATLAVNSNDCLFAYVYLDPANPPSEIMLQWNNGSWEHRAYWGANTINNGMDGTASRLYLGPLPAAGQWIRLEVAASKLGLEGSTLQGMAFTLCDGRAAWDCAGKAKAATTPAPTPTPPTVTVTASDAIASRVGPDTGTFSFSRSGGTNNSLTINFQLGGTATKWNDYRRVEGDMPEAVTIPAGALTTTLTVVPQGSTNLVESQTIILTLSSNAQYTLGAPTSAAIDMAGNSVPVTSVKPVSKGMKITWTSVVGHTYRVACASSATATTWTTISPIVTATAVSTSWNDTTQGATSQRTYRVYEVR